MHRLLKFGIDVNKIFNKFLAACQLNCRWLKFRKFSTIQNYKLIFLTGLLASSLIFKNQSGWFFSIWLILVGYAVTQLIRNMPEKNFF